jgi:hypothetical protein
VHLTRTERDVAAHLLHVWARCEALADELDPERTHRGDLVEGLDAIAQLAHRHFHRLTGRAPSPGERVGWGPAPRSGEP